METAFIECIPPLDYICNSMADLIAFALPQYYYDIRKMADIE